MDSFGSSPMVRFPDAIQPNGHNPTSGTMNIASASDRLNLLNGRFHELIAINASEIEFRDWLESAVSETLFNLSQINLTNPHSYDKEIIKEFLSPYRGPVWGAIFKLMQDGSQQVTCILPASHASITTRYASACPAAPMVQLRPFEFYLTSFFVHLTVASRGIRANEVYDCAYLKVLNDLIAFFLPVDGPFPIQNILRGSETGVKVPEPGGVSRRVTTPMGLFKKSFLSQQFTEDQRSDKRFLHGSNFRINETLDKTWAFVKIFSEVLLDSKGTSKQELPDTFRVSISRHIIKNVLRFCMTPTAAGNPSLQQIKASMIPRLIHQKLLDFLSDLFLRWPFDASFRVVMETWFSFIQPWRYTGEPLADCISSYENFLRENAEFYTVLFRLCVARFLRMDLNSARNVFLLQRLTKVISQSGFVEQIESLPNNRNVSQVSLSMSDLSYSGLETSDIQLLWENLLLQVYKSERKCTHRLREAEEEKKKRKITWWDRICGETEDPVMVADKKLKKDLEWISRTLQGSLKLNLNLEDCEAASTVSESDGRSFVSGSPAKIRPDSEWDCSGLFLHLTPTGQQQVRNRLRHYDFQEASSRAFPADLAPICSGENATLVRILYRAARKINQLFSADFGNLWNNSGALGRVSRKFLLSPTLQNRVEGPWVNDIPPLPPRISFRRLASYRTLVLLFIMVLLTVLSSSNAAGFLVFFMLIYVAFQVVCAIIWG